uniref:Cation-transporting ATPase n=1 Tax=Leptobrachium leishanense TaxID=445787 RepID=A0A8C5QCH5_9ANUR
MLGYRTERWRQILCIFGYVCSFGALRLLFYWKPGLNVWCHCVPCNLDTADVILLRTTDELKQHFGKKVSEIYPSVQSRTPAHHIITDKNSIVGNSIMMPEGKVRYINVHKIRYVWNSSDNTFMKVGVLDEGLSCSDVHTKFGLGLSDDEQEIRKQICGLNKIEVEIKPIWKLFVKEIFNAFYVFQAYSLCIWLASGYLEYAMAILIMAVMSITATIYNLRMQSVKLHKMAASYNSIMVTLLQKNGEVKSQSLVPGDVIILARNNLFLPCDAILISGGCTVNEGMLTGESIPVTKTPLPHISNSVPWKTYSGDDYKRHILFCGTKVIQTQPHGQDLVKAVVVQTGFNTAKGDLVRAILFNKPINVKLHKQAIKFLVGLLMISMCAVVYTAVIYTVNGVSYTITISVNAVLPAALTVCLLYAQTRLKKKGIFCISPQRINVAGQLNLVCFDKTGTLTEDILDLHGIVPSKGDCFQDMYYFSSGNPLPWGPMLGAMASCHSLIIMDGEKHGDPLDVKMFEGTRWVTMELDDLTDSRNKGGAISCSTAKPGSKVPVKGISILHQFPFSSTLRCMSVITQIIGEENLTVYLKGAPETVIRYCKPETVPPSFLERLDCYTSQGFRVIGLAYRSLEAELLPQVQLLEREHVETELTFLGLLIMENRLKPETTAVLNELSNANIRTVMVTGDNLQTALTVGKNCGMISSDSRIIMVQAEECTEDEPASVSWKIIQEIQLNRQQTNVCFMQLVPWFPIILLNGTIFARMTPRQKSHLIEEFQKLDYYVGMCGDGANDCGALKVAHAGISLSELEASVASPFTSNIPNIQCVPLLIKEGRNALVTSFSMFKFLSVYNLIGIFCVALLFWVLLLLLLLIYKAPAYSAALSAPKLAPYRPSGHLLSPPLLLSVFLHCIFSIIVQTTIFALLQYQPWFNDTDVFSACLPSNHSLANITMKEPKYAETFLTSTMFPVTGFNFIIIAFVFSKGTPFRQPLYTNYLHSLALVLQVVFYIFLLFADFEDVYTAMEVILELFYKYLPPTAFTRLQRQLQHIFGCTNFFLVSQDGFIENRKFWLWIKKKFNYKSKSQYRKLQRLLEKDRSWPLLNTTDYASRTPSAMDGNVLVCCNGIQHIPTKDLIVPLQEEIHV